MMDFSNEITHMLNESIETIQKSTSLSLEISNSVNLIVDSIKKDNQYEINRDKVFKSEALSNIFTEKKKNIYSLIGLLSIKSKYRFIFFFKSFL